MGRVRPNEPLEHLERELAQHIIKYSADKEHLNSLWQNLYLEAFGIKLDLALKGGLLGPCPFCDSQNAKIYTWCQPEYYPDWICPTCNQPNTKDKTQPLIHSGYLSYVVHILQRNGRRNVYPQWVLSQLKAAATKILVPEVPDAFDEF